MTRTQFDTWVEKKYPELLSVAKNMEEEKEDAEDLLQDTLLLFLEKQAYEGVTTERTDTLNPLFAVIGYMKMVKKNRNKKDARRCYYDGVLAPDGEEINPYPTLDTKILADQLYEQVSASTKIFLQGLILGRTAKETYNFIVTLDGTGAISYSYFLRKIKEDLSRVLS